MPTFKIALFDVDGVLLLPPKLFGDIYCEQHGIDPDTLGPFYASNEFKDSSIGKADLKDVIRLHKDKWQWEGDPADLIADWLQAENYPNHELLKIVDRMRADGVKVYIVTQQEKYRAAFLKGVFKGHYDGFLVSCEIGFHKPTPEFWQAVSSRLRQENGDVNPKQVVYFDDRQNLVDIAIEIGFEAILYTRLEDVTQRL